MALFAATASTGPGGPGVVGGLVWLAVIFVCVVVRELAHSLVARRRGTVVREIVLLPVGGVSKLESLPETPADEFTIAVVGPVASLGLAALCAAFALCSVRPCCRSRPTVDRSSCVWPGSTCWSAPSTCCRRSRSTAVACSGRCSNAGTTSSRATHVARVGRVLAVSLVAVGVLVNLWLLLIGVFVYVGASAEEAPRPRSTSVSPAGPSPRSCSTIRHPRSGNGTAAELGTLAAATQRVFPVVGPSGYVGLLRLGAVPYEPARLVADLADRRLHRCSRRRPAPSRTPCPSS